jgi:hypothetical protein
VADGVSLTELLDWIDPDGLPPEVQAAIREVGPALAEGLTVTEAAARAGRRKDWARDRRNAIRAAILEQAASRLDEMSPGLRARVVAEVAKLPPPRVRRWRPQRRRVSA